MILTEGIKQEYVTLQGIQYMTRTKTGISQVMVTVAPAHY